MSLKHSMMNNKNKKKKNGRKNRARQHAENVCPKPRQFLTEYVMVYGWISVFFFILVGSLIPLQYWLQNVTEFLFRKYKEGESDDGA